MKFQLDCNSLLTSVTDLQPVLSYIFEPLSKYWISCSQSFESQQMQTFTQGSRLTFQLASPVASERFDLLAKTNFSLARHRHLLWWHEEKILPDWQVQSFLALDSHRTAVKTSELVPLSFKIPIHNFHEQNTVLCSKPRHQCYNYRCRFREKFSPNFKTCRRKTNVDSRFLMNKIIHSILTLQVANIVVDIILASFKFLNNCNVLKLFGSVCADL